MILDTLQNYERYKNLHPLFARAFEYIQSLNADELTAGSTELDGDKLKAIVIERKSLTAEESLKGFECHNTYIDIQVSFSDQEGYAWKPRQDCKDPQAPYDEKRDVTFFNDAPDTFFTLRRNQFVIFYPEDVHTAMIHEHGISMRKLVMKVKVNDQ